MSSNMEYGTFFTSFFRRSLVVLCLFLISGQAIGQQNLLDKKISITLQAKNIHIALDSIANRSNCYFTYNPDLFSDEKNIQLDFLHQDLGTILRELIPDTTLTFEQLNRHIIIVPNDEATKQSSTTALIPNLSYRKIDGLITDQNGKTPLAYASIGIRGKHIGTITNQDGKFSLTLSSRNIQDTLVVSYIGFKNKEVPVAQIQDNSINIRLKENFISLQEVIIRNNDPVSLVRAAINKIENNYSQNATNLTSFYRESVLKNNRYMIYLESVLDVYKAPYKDYKLIDRVKIFKSRKIYDVSRLDTISFRLKGGIQGCLMLDIVKERPEFLDPEFISFYRYRLADISSYNNKSVYVIEFEPKPNLDTPLLKGKLLIATETLAIIQAEFGYETERLQELRNRFITKGSAKTKVKPLHVNYVVSYKNIDGKYYFNHTLGQLKFKVRNRRKFFSNTFSTTFEMATTEIDTVDIKRFKYRETIPPTSVMSQKKFAYDPDFWGPQNYIKPEENIQEALKRIQDRMQQVALGNGK